MRKSDLKNIVLTTGCTKVQPDSEIATICNYNPL